MSRKFSQSIDDTSMITRSQKKRKMEREKRINEIHTDRLARKVRNKEREREELRTNTLLKNEKFLEIIGVSLHDPPSGGTFVLEDERERMKQYVRDVSQPKYHGELPMNLDHSYSLIDEIWYLLNRAEIDPKTSEIMKKALDLAYATESAIFIDKYLSYFTFRAVREIEDYEMLGMSSDPSLFDVVIECFFTSLLDTAEYFLQYYSKAGKEPVAASLDKIKQLNCFERFYNELNREWGERSMILGAYKEYWKGKFQSEDGVEEWDRMSVAERIHHFQDLGMKLYIDDESCYDIIEDELIKLLKRIVDENQKDIFEKTGEQITKTTGFKGGKRKKSRKSKTKRKKKSRKSKK